MRKYLISLSLMVCLVLPGLVGNVYGQIDTVMPYRFLNQDILRLQLNPDDYPYDYNLRNDSHDYSKQTHKSSPSDYRMIIGFYYQKGWYQGEISNYVHNHGAYKMSFDVYIKRFFMQFSASGGRFDAGYVNINGDTFYQKFYGQDFGEGQILLGYEVACKPMFSIIPNIGYGSNYFGFSTTKGSNNGNQYSSTITYIRISHWSLGLLADYKLVKFGISKSNYTALRFQYDYCQQGKSHLLYNGNIHQLAFGFIVSL